MYYPPQNLPPAIVLIVLDDAALSAAPTPNMDALGDAGVRFTRAYAHPWCQPSRRSLLLGTERGVVSGDSCGPLRPESISGDTWVSTLRDAGFYTGLVGKWHVGRNASEGLPWYFAPHAVGFDHWYAGTATSALGPCTPGFNAVDDGVFSLSMESSTIREYHAFQQMLAESQTAGQPLFCWLATQDPHSPWTRPAISLLPASYAPPLKPTQRQLYQEEIMALDTMVGYVVSELPVGSWVILVSDNGIPMEVTLGDPTHAKLSPYEDGVKVDMVLWGAGLLPGDTTDLAHLYDLPATVLESLGLSGPTGDGRNLLSPVPYPHSVIVENPSPGINQSIGAVGERYKLIAFADRMEFYDLLLDPDELQNLDGTMLSPDAALAYDYLLGRIE